MNTINDSTFLLKMIQINRQVAVEAMIILWHPAYCTEYSITNGKIRGVDFTYKNKSKSII